MVLTKILNKLAIHKHKKQAKKTLTVLNNIKRDKKYGYFEHFDWIDVNNNIISHFSLHPDKLPQDSI